MRKIIFILAAVLVAATANAQIVPWGYQSASGGLTQTAADARYLQLSGGTMTGALTAAAAGITFNGSNLAANGANVVEQKNGANAQTFRVYNTTDGTNSEYGFGSWVANVFTLATDKAGTGTIRTIRIGNGNQVIRYGADYWQVTLTGHNQPVTPNSNDFGGASNTIRTGYFATAIEGSNAKSLTDGSATIFAKVAVASGSTWGGAIEFKLEGTNGTDFESTEGVVRVVAANKAGTITCAATNLTTTNAVIVTGATTQTLTGFTCADAGSNVLNILVQYSTSVTDSAGWPKIYHRLNSPDTAAYTPQ